MDEPTKKIVFVPGCFDEFDGTQEELDELMKEIEELVASGELFERMEPIEDGEFPEALLQKMSDYLDGVEDTRKLN